jgi:hypothetical protein
MSSVTFITDINILFIASSELESLQQNYFHLISVTEKAFNEILNFIRFADTSLSQMKLIRSEKNIIYKKKYAKIFEKVI